MDSLLFLLRDNHHLQVSQDIFKIKVGRLSQFTWTESIALSPAYNVKLSVYISGTARDSILHNTSMLSVSFIVERELASSTISGLTYRALIIAVLPENRLLIIIDSDSTPGLGPGELLDTGVVE